MPNNNDFRTKGTDELTFYVFNNLRGQAMNTPMEIFRYDTVDEAITKFNELPNDWTTAIGCSHSGVAEIDLVHKVNGYPVKVLDFYGMKIFNERTDVHEAMKKLEEILKIKYQLVFGIHPRRSVLVPLEAVDHIDSYMDNKLLYVSRDVPTNSFFSSMNEVYVEGEGWMGAREFLKEYEEDSYTNPKTPVVTTVNVNYIEKDCNWRGQCDISPVSFKNMLEKTKEYYLSNEKKKKAPSLDRFR